MTFYIHARDAAGCITLRRETLEAAVKKAEELEQMGCFEVGIV
jgi:predicted RNase H-like HicB family nuclease